MFSSNHVIGKLAIVIFGIVFAIIIGMKAVRFADNYAENAQNRIDTAFAVLDK